MGSKAQETGTKLIAQNRKARFNVSIEDTVEAGLALTGTEVKSCREGRVSLADAYAAIRGGEAWLMQCHINPYEFGNRANHDPVRPRKLLLHRGEIMRLEAKVSQGGRVLVPLRLYFKSGIVKAEIATGTPKKLYDKRATEAGRDAERQMRRQLGRRR